MAYEQSVSEWLAAEVIVQEQTRQRKSTTEKTAMVSPGQRSTAARFRSVSVRRESLSPGKQTVEDVS